MITAGRKHSLYGPLEAQYRFSNANHRWLRALIRFNGEPASMSKASKSFTTGARSITSGRASNTTRILIMGHRSSLPPAPHSAATGTISKPRKKTENPRRKKTSAPLQKTADRD